MSSNKGISVSAFTEWLQTTVGISQDSSTSLACTHVDGKIIEKTWRYMEKVVKLCENERLKLRNSPPYILDIVPETYHHLKTILECYQKRSSKLNSILYIKVFLTNVWKKCKYVITLFQNEDIFDHTSKSREQLTFFSLIFSHMLHELKALFPEGKFIEDRYRITKLDAQEFWTNCFNKRVIVSFAEFIAKLGDRHPIGSPSEMMSLRTTIDLSHNNFVSIFEFDIFTRLFQPFDTLLTNWNVLAVTHPAFLAYKTYDEVKQILEQFIHLPGSYVYRQSCTRLGLWAIGYVTSKGEILQTITHNKSLIQALIDGSRDGFYQFPLGQEINPDLTRCLSQEEKIIVTEEQYDLYSMVYSSFEQCKICQDRDKDIRLEPCGHLMCTQCYKDYKAGGNNICPFCRSEIRCTESVIIEPFAKKKSVYVAPPLPPRNNRDDSAKENESSEATNFMSTEYANVVPPLPPRRQDGMRSMSNPNYGRISDATNNQPTDDDPNQYINAYVRAPARLPCVNPFKDDGFSN